MSAETKEQDHISRIKAKIHYGEFIAMMAALMAVNALAIDIMLPALHDIAKDLNVAIENDQHYIIFSFLIGFGLMQLFFGSISDRFGRRIPLIFGLIIYIIAAIFCILVNDFTSFLFWRFIQGVGASATRVLIVSIIRDLYTGRQMARVMSIVMVVFMMVPVLAPATGQTLMLFGSWKIIFFFMALIATLLTIWIFFRLPETIYDKKPLSLKQIGLSFKAVFSNRTALCYNLAFSVILGGLFGALNTAEQIYNGVYKLGKLFPLAFAAVAISQAVSAFTNSRLVERIGMHKISHTMLLIYFFASSIWFSWTYFNNGEIPFIAYMILFIFVMISFGFLGANFNTLAMEPLGKIAGTASAVFGFLQTIIGALLGFFISQHFNGTTMPIAFGFLILGIVAIILVLIAEKGKLFCSSSKEEK